MAKFKYDDRVILTHFDKHDYTHYIRVGMIGTINDHDNDEVPWVLFDNGIKEVIQERHLEFLDLYQTPLFNAMSELEPPQQREEDETK